MLRRLSQILPHSQGRPPRHSRLWMLDSRSSTLRTPGLVGKEVWRPRSAPTDPMGMQRTLCSLLNKLSVNNFYNIANAIVDCALTMERMGDPTKLASLASSLLVRALSDGVRAWIYACLCQMIIAATSRERAYWGSADPYGLFNPFGMTLRAMVQCEIAQALEGDDVQRLAPLTAFVTELLILGSLDANTVEILFDTLFTETEKNDEAYSVILHRSLLRLTQSPQTKDALESLAIADSVDHLLRQPNILPKIRYFLLSAQDRIGTEEYIPGGVQDPLVGGYVSDMQYICLMEARAFLSSRRLDHAVTVLQRLQPDSRHVFIANLVSLTIASNDLVCAELVGSLFSLDKARELCCSQDSFAKGFEVEVVMLEDTVLDLPRAYHLMALMMHTCGMSGQDVEALVSRIARTRRKLREHLLAQVATIENDHNR